MSGVLAAPPAASKRPLFNASSFRPEMALNEMPLVATGTAVAVSGVVFSHAPIDRVTVSDRAASLRQAEPKDLVRLVRVPSDAPDAPHRTYFEVRDVPLGKPGANEIEIRALDNDGRSSDLHRVTVVRLTQAPQEQGK